MARFPVRPAVLAALAALLAVACGSDPGSGVQPSPPISVPASPGPPAGASPSRTASAAVDVPVAGAPPVSGRPWFLTVGDSITSGYTVDPARAGTNAAWPVVLEQLLAAGGRSWSLYDTACPGETTTTYRTGCHDQRVRAALDGRPQRDAALAAIAAHRADLKLIVVDLGSNDLLRALRRAFDVSVTAGVADSLRTALTGVVSELRAAAPGVPLLLANFYNPLENILGGSEAQLAPVNAVIAQVARAQGAILVDVHAAFNTDPPPDPGLCTYVDCAHLDVHPTVAGHRRLAQAVLAAVPAS